jgi:hypothetical protein
VIFPGGDALQKLALIKRVGFVAFEAAFILFYARLRILNSYAIRAPRISFGDTRDYLLIASKSIFSPQFWLSDKPFLIPLFFKSLGKEPERIFNVQLELSIVCWAILAITCALVIRSYPLKLLASAIVLGFSLTQQVILWDSLLLTESLHFSIAALFYSSGLLLAVRWNKINAVIFIVLAALLAFTRDASAYMLLMAGALSLILLILFKGQRLRFLLISGSFTAIFLVSSLLASLGNHSYSALLNIVTDRILKNTEYTAYMEHQGMPVSYLSLPDSANISNWDALRDPRLSNLRLWAREHGTVALAGFLWHYKADTLQKPLEDPVSVFAPDLYYYSATGFKPILETTWFAEFLYPMRFGVIMFWMANLVAAFLSAYALQKQRVTWVLALLMILLAYPQIVFTWNTDPHDLLRHSLSLNVQWRLGLWLLILLLADDVIGRLTLSLQGRMSRISGLFDSIFHKEQPQSLEASLTGLMEKVIINGSSTSGGHLAHLAHVLAEVG